jgi:hypothetical protein
VSTLLKKDKKGAWPRWQVVVQLRKLPWRAVEEYLIKCLLRAHKAKHAGSGMHLAASLVARLARHRAGFSIKVNRSRACVRLYVYSSLSIRVARSFYGERMLP